MTRRLILMRHAKSAWDTEASTDHARPLNKRGRGDAPRIADELVRRGWIPELCWSSDAQRTRQTWELMEPQFEADIPATFVDVLYLAGLGALQGEADEWPSSAGTILSLGHNPGWSEAASRLTGVALGMTTANAAMLEGEGATWSEAIVRPWRLAGLLRPRELGD
ncbi:MAG: histidine phosphatase family protein [Proteobacteria bacterium]|nr:histidine phosphatase family protein [Pseudomonadota bacterium]